MRCTLDVDSVPSLSHCKRCKFEPLTQARPDLHCFKTEGSGWVQSRSDRRHVGALATSDVPVTNIRWQQSNDKLRFEMQSADPTAAPACTGYCEAPDKEMLKHGDYNARGWTAVVVQVGGKCASACNATNDEEVLSPTLCEALATGVAYAKYGSDPSLQVAFPELAHTAGLLIPAVTAVVAAVPPSSPGLPLPRKDVLPQGIKVPPKASVADDATVKSTVISAANVPEWIVTDPFIRYDKRVRNEQLYISTAPYQIDVRHNIANQPIGAIFPLEEDVHALADAATVDRIHMREIPLRYKAPHDKVKHISKYEVEIYSRQHADGNKPMATLSVTPVAIEDRNTEPPSLSLRHHITKPKIDTLWTLPQNGYKPTVVAESEVRFALLEQPAWDPRLRDTIATAIYKLRTSDGVTVV